MSEFKDFCCSYNHHGVEYVLTIRAVSFDDAAERLKRIGSNGRVDGILMGTIPAFPGAGVFVRRLAWLLNKLLRQSTERPT